MHCPLLTQMPTPWELTILISVISWALLLADVGGVTSSSSHAWQLDLTHSRSSVSDKAWKPIFLSVASIDCKPDLSAQGISPSPSLLSSGNTVITGELLYLMIQDLLCIFLSPALIRKSQTGPRELFLVFYPAILIPNTLQWVVRAGDFPLFCANKTRINSTGWVTSDAQHFNYLKTQGPNEAQNVTFSRTAISRWETCHVLSSPWLLGTGGLLLASS